MRALKLVTNENFNYQSLLEYYEYLYNVGFATKHHTHDSVFYIHYTTGIGFRATKFYNDGVDVREGSNHSSPSEAYSEAELWM